MKLIVGLGNPGTEYEKHRHNIGFMAIDALADHFRVLNFKDKSKALVADVRVNSEKMLLVKPQTYMNLSGESVGDLARFYKIAPEDILVFHDELDLKAGDIRIKKGGGHAGHNGLKSIDSHIGTPDYWRVRVGIGHPGDKAKVTGHVLGNFSQEDKDWVEKFLAELPKKADKLLTEYKW